MIDYVFFDSCWRMASCGCASNRQLRQVNVLFWYWSVLLLASLRWWFWPVLCVTTTATTIVTATVLAFCSFVLPFRFLEFLQVTPVTHGITFGNCSSWFFYASAECNVTGRIMVLLPARRYASAGLCDSDVFVRLSVRHTPVLWLAEWKQDHEMYIIW